MKRKFATQLDEKVLRDLQVYAKTNDQKISSVVNAALEEYLLKFKMRPAFRSAMNKVILENERLLRRLAR